MYFLLNYPQTPLRILFLMLSNSSKIICVVDRLTGIINTQNSSRDLKYFNTEVSYDVSFHCQNLCQKDYVCRWYICMAIAEDFPLRLYY